MNDHLQLPSDLALEAQTRAGSAAAWTELRDRHVDAIEALARVRSSRRTREAVDDVFSRLFQDITTAEQRPDDRPDAPTRPRAIGLLTGGAYGPERTMPTATGVDAAPNSDSATDGQVVDEPSSGQLSARLDQQELVDVATAFGRLPTMWQAVLWHRWVERAPAAELTAILGRPAAEVMALEQTAHRGLVDACAEVRLADVPDPLCVPIIPLLGAHRRGALPDAQRRAVDAHLEGSGEPSTGCTSCSRHLEVIDRLPEVAPIAVAPGLVGVGLDRYREVIGAGALAIGAAALAARRSDRERRFARVGAVAAVVVALLAAAFFVRAPFGDLDSELADLIDRVTTTTVPADPTPDPDGPGTEPEALANRIELVFPGAPQGAVLRSGWPGIEPGDRPVDTGTRVRRQRPERSTSRSPTTTPRTSR